MHAILRKALSALLSASVITAAVPIGVFSAPSEMSGETKVDLVLFMGQSNMAGRGNAEEAPQVTEGHGYEFRSVTDPTRLYNVTEPFGENENNDVINDNSGNGNNRRAGGMVSALINSYYESAGVPIVGVQCSQGGKNTKYFKQAKQLNEAVSRYNSAAAYLEENGYTIRRKFVVWCQGESDADGINTTSEDTIASSLNGYKLRTTEIFDYLEENTGITNEFIVRTGHFNYKYYDAPTDEQIARDNNYLRVANAQGELADNDEQIDLVASFYTDEAFDGMCDPWHYNQVIYNKVGEMAGHNIAAVYDDSIEVIPVPDTENLGTPIPEETQSPDISTDTEVLFDFNTEAVPSFSDTGNGSLKNVLAVKSESDKYLQVNASKASKTSVASGYMDLTQYTEWAQEIEISFDMHIPYQSRSCIALVDKSIRGEDHGGSVGDGYSTAGTIFNAIGQKNGKLMIDGVNIGPEIITESGDDLEWVHYDIALDLLKKTMSYSVTSLDGTVTYTSGQNKNFADNECGTCTGIETFSWVSKEQLSMDNLCIKASVPDAAAKITGAETISKTKNKTITREYSIDRNYEDDSDVFEWSVSGVEGVSINADTGVLSADGVAGGGTATVTATVISSDKLAVGTKLTYNVEILDFAVIKNFEIISADKVIDISALETYGTDCFRLYKPDGSYETVTAQNGTVENKTECEVVVVPEYKFEFTNQTNPIDPLIKGYVKVGENSYKYGKGYGLTDANYNINENGCSPKDGRVIKVDLPDGIYDFSIYRLGRDHTDIYANGVLIGQNTSSTAAQNRPSDMGIMYAPGMTIEGGNANISFGNCGDKARIASIKIARVPEFARKSVVWVAGDSESADYYPIDKEGDDLENPKIMMTGFGMQLGKVLSDKYDVVNFGQQSYTAQLWADECLTSLSHNMKKGDSIIIDFGINDGHKNVGEDVAKEYIKKIADTAKAAQAQPILVSPVYNMDYQNKSYFTYNPETGKNSLEDFAKELGVPFIDLNRYTQEYIEQAKTQTGDEKWTENNYHVNDTLHLTQHSALLAADFIAAGMKKIGYETTDFAYIYKDISGTVTDKEGNTVRGTETGAIREYSIAAVENMVNPYIPSDKTENTPMPTAKPTVTPDPNVTPGPILYEEDFEDYSVGSNGGWETKYGVIEVAEDKEKGKYLRKASNGSSSARSGWINLPLTIDENFVFEADIKTGFNQNQISSFEIVEKESSIYKNHGVYSNAQYAFKLARPEGANVYVINNKISDSNLTLDKYAQPAVVTDEIGDGWLHIKVVGDFANKTAIAYITSLDSKVEYYHGMTDMSDGMNSFKCLSLISPSNVMYTCIDDIVIRKATSNDLMPKYHKVTITDFGESFNQYVLEGESVINIPNTSAYGENFEGWLIGDKLYSTEEIAKVPITEDCIITSKISDRYIEPMKTVEFNEFPENGVLEMGMDGNTFADNMISLKITGERGTSFVLNPNEKVEDYKIEWSFDGFRTLDGKPTGENGSSYCDSYGLIEINKKAQTSVNFKLKNTAANYYGKVTAKVTYNGETVTVSKGLVITGDKVDSSILPRKGYTSDFSKYEKSMLGTHINDNNAVAFDSWQSSSDTETCYASLEEENGMKFIRFTRTAKGQNVYLYNQIAPIDSQTNFSMDVRFNANADLYFTDGSSGDKEDRSKEAFRLTFDGSTISLNGTELAKAGCNIWYHTEISVSPDTKTIECRVYDAAGNLLGSGNAAYSGDQITTQKYIVLKPSKSAGTIDINNVRVTDEAVDENSVEITGKDTIAIPEIGNIETVISVTAKTVSGFSSVDRAIWDVEGTNEGISIKADTENSHNAILTVTNQSASGYIDVKCIIDGVAVTKTIKLTGIKDNVAFINAPTGVMIPLSGEKNIEYGAVVRNGQAEDIPGKNITYSLEQMTDGVRIDSVTGILTVTDQALPGTIVVNAVSTDANGNEISKSVNVALYNLKFSLGAEKTGYTTVNADDIYSDAVGYGITGKAVCNDGTLTGNGFGFNVKLECGKVYKVTVKHEGELVYEKKNSYMTGIIPADDKFVDGDSIDIALFGDDILDIALTAEGKISTIEITPVDKSVREKPNWWTIGDSTVAQSGSWASTLGEENDIVNYPYLTEVIDEFYNSGCAGRQHMSFYNQGWFNYILANMNPGDVVSISGMGTNQSSATKEMFVQFNNFYIDAITEMGGYVVLGTYTPTGNYGETEGKVYDADTMTFKGRRTHAYEQAVREVYEARKNEQNVIGFVDIGKMCDEKLSKDVQKVYNDALTEGKSDTEARMAANERANEIMGWWKDYNHYYNTLSRYFLPELTAEMAELISGIDGNENNRIEISYSNDTVTVISNDKTVRTAKLFHVTYKEQRVVSINSTELDLSVGSAVVNEKIQTGDKLFVWDGFEPLGMVYTAE